MSSEDRQRKPRVSPRLGRALSKLGFVTLVLATILGVWLALVSTANLVMPVFPGMGSAILCGLILSFTARRIRNWIRDVWRGEQNRKTDVITTCIAFAATALLLLCAAWLLNLGWQITLMRA